MQGGFIERFEQIRIVQVERTAKSNSAVFFPISQYNKFRSGINPTEKYMSIIFKAIHTVNRCLTKQHPPQSGGAHIRIDPGRNYDTAAPFDPQQAKELLGE